jgi:hypothetical protein
MQSTIQSYTTNENQNSHQKRFTPIISPCELDARGSEFLKARKHETPVAQTIGTWVSWGT